jgi:hypothetical protein
MKLCESNWFDGSRSDDEGFRRISALGRTVSSSPSRSPSPMSPPSPRSPTVAVEAAEPKCTVQYNPANRARRRVTATSTTKTENQQWPPRWMGFHLAQPSLPSDLAAACVPEGKRRGRDPLRPRSTSGGMHVAGGEAGGGATKTRDGRALTLKRAPSRRGRSAVTTAALTSVSRSP